MTLQIEIEIPVSKYRVEPIAKRARIVAAHQHPRQRTHRTAGEADHSRAKSFEIFQRDTTLALGRVSRRAIRIYTDHPQL